MAAAALKQLKQTRASRDIAAERISEVFQVALTAVDDDSFHSIFKTRFSSLENTYVEFNTQHNSVVHILAVQDDPDLSAEKIVRQEVDKQYFRIKCIYTSLFENVPPPNPSASCQSNVKLPKLNVPSFDGKLKTWPSFIGLFDSLIHNNKSITDIEKFQYLLSVVTGEALTLIKNIPLTNDNYSIAYKNMTSRFQNKRILSSFHWEEINKAPKLTCDSPRTLRQLLDIFSDNLKALENLGFPVGSWDFVLFHLLCTKIDSDSLKRFELEHASSEVPTYDSLYDFLDKQCVALDSLALSKSHKTGNHSQNKNIHTWNKPSSSHSAATLLTNTRSNIPKCPICNSNHTIYTCPDFSAKSPQNRYDLVKQNKWCTRCLGTKHTPRECTSKAFCKVCSQPSHHTLLHFPVVSPPASTTSGRAFQINSSENEPSTTHINSMSSFLPTYSTVLLSTAQVEVLDARGNYQTVRILLDSGSQASFITEKCANKLGLPPFRLPLAINGLGNMSSMASKCINCTLRPLGLPSPFIKVEAAIVPKLCADMPAFHLSTENWSHLSNIRLADKHFNIPGSVDMLLGADVFSVILKDGKLPGRSYEPTAFNTIFGWIVMGKTSFSAPHRVNALFSTCNCPLKQFWQLEEIPSHSTLSPEEVQCEKFFIETYKRDPSGRYTVALPFKEQDPYFSDTRTQALRRFYALESRLLKNPQLYILYSNFMRDYLHNGYMEAITPPASSGKMFYIPHHCVTNPNSKTTKLRVVFDASVKSPHGPSLNDTLLTGKKLQLDIVSLLLKFRLYPFVFTADIKHMFLRIFVADHHQDYQRILWRFNSEDTVQDFRLRTVSFGVSSSPFMSIRTLYQLAADERKRFPLGAQALLDCTYIDDVIIGSHTLENLKHIQLELIELLKSGGFHLHKWASNHSSLLENIHPSDCQQTDLSFDSPDTTIKILGLKWQPTLDYFSYDVFTLDAPCTKRSILSEISRIFDPLGFLAPLVFFGKYLIQYLWALGLQWDSIAPPEIVEKWTKYKNELPCLSNIKIPRLLTTLPYDSCEIHGFSDSSERGFAAVVYFRYILPDGSFKIQLICGKSKVAPLKRICIPRLELCAASLLATLMAYVMNTYAEKVHFEKIFAWTDSMVALSWIKSSAHRWKTFVSNRVSLIQDNVSPTNWYHVRSADNPADCASRGLLPGDLVNHPLWFTGPPWLGRPREDWPCSGKIDIPSQVYEEEKTISLISFTSIESLDSLLDKYSSLDKITRILAYCMRFLHNVRKRNDQIKSNVFTTLELTEALLILVKRIQHISFSQEISKIERKILLPKTFRKLNPFIGEDGLLRVGGRLHFSGLLYDQKHPVLLPSKHRLTYLIIENAHKKHLHAGLQTLHFLLAQQFWILSPKRAIRHVLSKCMVCFKVNPTPLEPYMGRLPPSRINQLKPFQSVGVDYGGPFNVTLGKSRGIKSQKAYICLFMCFVTKAVHLELASDLSSEAFIAALRRFVSRRGHCTQITSDCGSNFIDASRILSDFIKQAAEGENIKFSFNAPSSPHFNGLSEAGIKSVKAHLYRTIGNQVLTYEEFYTLLTQIEAVLNSRPLCPQSSDPNDLSVLTPGHFLTLAPLSSVPNPDLSHLKLNHLNRWQLVQRLQQDIWKRWNTEYLHTLQQRQKWLKGGKTIVTGDLVVIKNELTPPMHWRLARVVETHPGADGIVRVATVRTNQGVFQRPLVKLCPLAIQRNES